MTAATPEPARTEEVRTTRPFDGLSQEANAGHGEASIPLAAGGDAPFRMLFDLMPELGWTARPDGVIDFYNRRWHEYTGRTFEEMLGRGWEAVHDPDSLPLVVERWQQALISGEPFEMEFPLRRADGVFRWFLTRVVPVRDARGAIVRWIGIATDIHEKRLRNRASQEMLRLFIDSNQDYAIFILDPDGNVRTWNAGAERMKQYRAEEIIGRHFSVFYPPAVTASGSVARELVTAASVGRFEEEGIRLRKDGSQFWASVVITAMRDEHGALLGFSKVTRDLTERRKSEEARITLLRAQEAVRVRDEFLSIASHELKTPLTSLQLIASGIARGMKRSTSFRPDKLFARFDGQLRQLTGLINDLLDVSRMVGGQLRLQLEVVDLEVVLADVTERLKPGLASANCPLVVRVEGPLVGSWDRLRLAQIASNLLTNALKYGPGHSIEVAATREGNEAVLSITDGGIGIAEADQERIFERFARAVSPEHYGGFGLGLWIVRQFTEAMQGTVTVKSKEGAGACFTVRLPLAPPAIA